MELLSWRITLFLVKSSVGWLAGGIISASRQDRFTPRLLPPSARSRMTNLMCGSNQSVRELNLIVCLKWSGAARRKQSKWKVFQTFVAEQTYFGIAQFWEYAMYLTAQRGPCQLSNVNESRRQWLLTFWKLIKVMGILDMANKKTKIMTKKNTCSHTLWAIHDNP